MAKTAVVRARIEPELKQEAEAILRELGLTPTEAITLFYKQVALRRGLPFSVSYPEITIRPQAVREEAAAYLTGQQPEQFDDETQGDDIVDPFFFIGAWSDMTEEEHLIFAETLALRKPPERRQDEIRRYMELVGF